MLFCCYIKYMKTLFKEFLFLFIISIYEIIIIIITIISFKSIYAYSYLFTKKLQFLYFKQHFNCCYYN